MRKSTLFENSRKIANKLLDISTAKRRRFDYTVIIHFDLDVVLSITIIILATTAPNRLYTYH
jgi:hypothetical protein